MTDIVTFRSARELELAEQERQCVIMQRAFEERDRQLAELRRRQEVRDSLRVVR
jgi:hypothetical protein